jgi:O-acetylserine/cysteine efflux transporter
VLVLGEPLGWHKLVGGALTIAGVAVMELLGGVMPPKDEPEPGA